MHDAAARRAPWGTPADPAFGFMGCPAVIEVGERLVSGRISPREFDAVVEQERAAWERQQAAGSMDWSRPVHPPPGTAQAARVGTASFRG